MSSSTDRIEKRVTLRAPRARVWRALTEQAEFEEWFRVKLQSPFRPGATVRGHVTYPGYEHLAFEAVVDRMEPERYFSYRWHPAPMDPSADYSAEPMTLVEFSLEDAAGGTLLTIVESGFDRLPLERRADAYRMNEGGWAEQARNIERHVAQG